MWLVWRYMSNLSRSQSWSRRFREDKIFCSGGGTWTIPLHTKYISGDHIKEKEMGGAFSTRGGEEMCMKNIVEKTWV